MEVVDFLGPEGFGAHTVDWSGSEPVFTRVHHKPSKLLIPGFVDIHIHGGLGIDCFTEDTKAITALCDKLETRGYESILPTTVTGTVEQVQAAINAIPDHPMIAGFHLEGPFISAQFPGAQPASCIAPVPVGSSKWDAVLDHPKLKIVTLAPEIPNALELILKLNQRNVIVSMGHSNATYDQFRRGYEFGARHVTHVFNAMRGFHHREVGATGYALMNDDLACEIIYDRHHLSKEALQLLLKVKPIEKIIAISDGTAASGAPHGTGLRMWGHECFVEHGAVRIQGSGALAGSASTMLDCFRNIELDFDTETAIRLCCLNPRHALGKRGLPRVFIELDDNREIINRRVR